MTRKVKRDAVIKREAATRRDRAEVSPSRKDREISDDERVEMLRQSMFQSSLPDLPVKAGVHRCWLTTTNPRDSIVSRERLGYTLIKASDIPGWQFHASKSGDYQGYIMVNEMIAAEIPTRLFERYMGHNHHEEPLFSEQQLVAKTKEQQEEAASLGAQLIESPGANVLGQDPGAPNFSDAYNES